MARHKRERGRTYPLPGHHARDLRLPGREPGVPFPAGCSGGEKKLPAAETELETYRQQAEERAEQLDAEYQAAKKKAANLNCRKDLQSQRFLVADLRKASERFAKLTAQKERLAEVKERIKAIDEELETIPADIESREADRFVVEDELKKSSGRTQQSSPALKHSFRTSRDTSNWKSCSRQRRLKRVQHRPVSRSS